MPKGVYQRNEKHGKLISESLKGKFHSDETKRKISESSKGKHHSEEAKHKIAQATKKRYLSEVYRKKLSEARKGKGIGRIGAKSPFWKGGKIKTFCKTCNKEIRSKPSHIKRGQGKFCSYKCRAIWNMKHMKKRDTFIELAIEQELIKRHIPYLKQAPIEGIALVDFLLADKIIIQCDGDYWHSRKLNKGKDIAQDTVLYFKGYKVFRFTETEIKKSAEKCIEKVVN